MELARAVGSFSIATRGLERGGLHSYYLLRSFAVHPRSGGTCVVAAAWPLIVAATDAVAMVVNAT